MSRFEEVETLADVEQKLRDYVTELAEQLIDAECVAPDDVCNHCLAEAALAFVEAHFERPDPNDCAECARSNGPHYTGRCEHA
jgi:hypothetical protein